MQKFTRPLTREIEAASGRLALTFDDKGISVRPVGSRKPPYEMTWGALLCAMTGHPAGDLFHPSADEVTAAIEALKKPPAANPASETVASGTVASCLARLEKWLAKHRSGYLKGLLPGASAADLEAAQKALGIPLPEDVRALLSWHNGQSTDFVGHFERDFDLLSASQIADAKKTLDAGDRKQSGWQPEWIPFLQDDSDNCVCLDTRQAGAPVREVWQGQKDHAVAAPSLAAWLEKFVSAVEKGDYQEDPERGTFLPSRS